MKSIINIIKNKIIKKDAPVVIEGESYDISNFIKNEDNTYSIEIQDCFSQIFNNSNIEFHIELTNNKTKIEIFLTQINQNNIFIENLNNDLKIKTVGKFNKDESKITLFINKDNFLKINSITNKSNCDLLLENLIFEQEELNLNVFGSGNIKVKSVNSDTLFVNHCNTGQLVFNEINSNNVHFNVSKSATIKVQSGKSSFINISSKDLSKIIAKNFKTTQANVNLNSAGNVLLNVSKNVKGQISGIGNLQLSNKEVDIDVRISGLGSVKFK